MKFTARKLLLLATLLFFGGATLLQAEPQSQRRKRKKHVVKQEVAETTPQQQTPAEKAKESAPQGPVLTPRQEADTTLTPMQYDSLAGAWLESRTRETLEQFFQEYIAYDLASVAAGTTPDSVYVRRLRELASPIELPYNAIVKASIDRYMSPTSGLIGRILGRAHSYFPMIEDELIKAGLPVELRAMAIIESALLPNAVSPVGAAGLWQFMPSTGKVYGLEVNSLVDERYDPLKATQAACRFLKDLYGIYNNWPLAIAAYNCGPGNVNKAMARSGGKTFWEIYDFLPRETRGYVPNFIAASYAVAYHGAHGLKADEPLLPLATDTLHLKRLLHLGQISSTLDEVPLETLKLLNPQYRLSIVPASATKSYALTLPMHSVSRYIANESLIHSKDSTYLKEYLNPANVEKQRAQASGTIYHKVRRGETLGVIARKYGVTQKNIMRWNGIKNADRIREGQRLKIVRNR